MNFSSRELLYMEDVSGMFDTIAKSCSHCAMEANDQQVKSTFQSLAQDHQQWATTIAGMVSQSGTMQ